MARATTLSFVAIACVVGTGVADGAEINAMGGTYSEQVTSIGEEDGRLMVRTGRRAIPLETIKSIRFQKATLPAGATKLVLTNGDYLRCAVEGGTEDAVGVRSTALGTWAVPFELLRAVIPASDVEHERGLEGQLNAKAEVDSVRLKNGGTVKGSVTQVDGTRVSIDTDSEGGSRMGEMSFAWTKVEMISIALLDEPPASSDELKVVLRLTDGSSLTGTIERFAQNKLAFRHPLGGKKPLEIPVSKIAELVVKGGAFVYVSDIDPVDVKQYFPPEYKYEVDVWGFKKDTNVTGGKLRLDGQVFEKGLGVHSYCSLTYKLGGKYSQFKSVIGLDDSTRYLGEPGFGAVIFQVLVDGKPAAEYPSGIVKKKGDKASELLIDLKGKGSLTLVAAFDPTSLHVLGRANWADAHLIRQP